MSARSGPPVHWLLSVLVAGCGQAAVVQSPLADSGPMRTDTTHAPPWSASVLQAFPHGVGRFGRGREPLPVSPAADPWQARSRLGSHVLAAEAYRPAIVAKLAEQEARAARATPPLHVRYTPNRLWHSPKGTNVIYFDGTSDVMSPSPHTMPIVGLYYPDSGRINAFGPKTSHEGMTE